MRLQQKPVSTEPDPADREFDVSRAVRRRPGEGYREFMERARAKSLAVSAGTWDPADDATDFPNGLPGRSVWLEEDVARAFPDSAAVNAALRGLLAETAPGGG